MTYSGMDHNVRNNSGQILGSPAIPLLHQADSKIPEANLHLNLVILVVKFRTIKEETIADSTILVNREVPVHTTMAAVHFLRTRIDLC
jgi:hypothetical protein